MFYFDVVLGKNQNCTTWVVFAVFWAKHVIKYHCYFNCTLHQWILHLSYTRQNNQYLIRQYRQNAYYVIKFYSNHTLDKMYTIKVNFKLIIHYQIVHFLRKYYTYHTQGKGYSVLTYQTNHTLSKINAI